MYVYTCLHLWELLTFTSVLLQAKDLQLSRRKCASFCHHKSMPFSFQQKKVSLILSSFQPENCAPFNDGQLRLYKGSPFSIPLPKLGPYFLLFPKHSSIKQPIPPIRKPWKTPVTTIHYISVSRPISHMTVSAIC